MSFRDLIFKSQKTKEQIVLFSYLKPKTKKRESQDGGCSGCWNKNGVGFRERRSSFSLRSRAIGPLDFDGARRENVLRGAGYAWTPGLRVFDNSKR